MNDILANYGLFLLKTLTVVIAISFILAQIAQAKKMSKTVDALVETKKLNAHFAKTQEVLAKSLLSKNARKKLLSSHKKEKKRTKPRLYVLTFKGDIRASAAEALREEVTAILLVAQPKDEVLVRLESPGGCVHDYGFAAAQLTRLRARNIPLTVAVDKMAASGGYLMAAVASTIIASPFAVIGSIGVIFQAPNFHALLKEKNISFEQLTAGEDKRTLTLFGANTDVDRQKTQAQINQIHQLFIEFVQKYRPNIDPKEVATGKTWHAIDAIEHQLVDTLLTSDDFLYNARDTFDIRSKNHYRIPTKSRNLPAICLPLLCISLCKIDQHKMTVIMESL